MRRISIFLISFCFVIPLFCNSLENEVLEVNNLQEYYESTTESESEIKYKNKRKEVYTDYNNALEEMNQNIIDRKHKGTEELEHSLEVLINIKSTIDQLLERHVNLRMQLLEDLDEAIKYARTKVIKV